MASVFKKVVAELMGWFDAQVEEAKHYEKKERGEISDPVIGGEILNGKSASFE